MCRESMVVAHKCSMGQPPLIFFLKRDCREPTKKTELKRTNQKEKKIYVEVLLQLLEYKKIISETLYT